MLLLHFGLNDLLQQPARPAVSACRRDLKQPPALWSERETERQTETERGTDRQRERETDLLSSGFFSTPSPVQAPGKFAVSYPQLAASAASFSDCSHDKTGVGATVASAGAQWSRLTDRLVNVRTICIADGEIEGRTVITSVHRLAPKPSCQGVIRRCLERERGGRREKE